MRVHQKYHFRQRLYRLGILLKGLDAVVEFIGGITLLIVNPRTLDRAARWLTAGELSEDPHDLVSNFIRHAASHVSISSEHFMAAYLLVHGIVKGAVVAALLRGKLWAYPLALFVFTGFIAYQIYRFTLTGGWGLIALTVFDFIVCCLIWLEYRAVKAGEVG